MSQDECPENLSLESKVQVFEKEIERQGRTLDLPTSDDVFTPAGTKTFSLQVATPNPGGFLRNAISWSDCNEMLDAATNDSLQGNIERILQEEKLDPMAPNDIHLQLVKDLGIGLEDRKEEVLDMIREKMHQKKVQLTKDDNNNMVSDQFTDKSEMLMLKARSDIDESIENGEDLMGDDGSGTLEPWKIVNDFIKEWLNKEFWDKKKQLQDEENEKQVMAMLSDWLDSAFPVGRNKGSRGRKKRNLETTVLANEGEAANDPAKSSLLTPPRTSSRAAAELAKVKNVVLNMRDTSQTKLKASQSYNEETNKVPENKVQELVLSKANGKRPRKSETTEVNTSIVSLQPKNGPKNLKRKSDTTPDTDSSKTKRTVRPKSANSANKSVDGEQDPNEKSETKVNKRVQRSASAKNRDFYSPSLQDVEDSCNALITKQSKKNSKRAGSEEKRAEISTKERTRLSSIQSGKVEKRNLKTYPIKSMKEKQDNINTPSRMNTNVGSSEKTKNTSELPRNNRKRSNTNAELKTLINDEKLSTRSKTLIQTITQEEGNLVALNAKCKKSLPVSGLGLSKKTKMGAKPGGRSESIEEIPVQNIPSRDQNIKQGRKSQSSHDKNKTINNKKEDKSTVATKPGSKKVPAQIEKSKTKNSLSTTIAGDKPKNQAHKTTTHSNSPSNNQRKSTPFQMLPKKNIVTNSKQNPSLKTKLSLEVKTKKPQPSDANKNDLKSESRPKRGAAVLAGIKSISMKADEEEHNNNMSTEVKIPFLPAHKAARKDQNEISIVSAITSTSRPKPKMVTNKVIPLKKSDSSLQNRLKPNEKSIFHKKGSLMKTTSCLSTITGKANIAKGKQMMKGGVPGNKSTSQADKEPMDFLKMTQMFSERLAQSPFSSTQKIGTSQKISIEKKTEYKCEKCPAFYLDLAGLQKHDERNHKPTGQSMLKNTAKEGNSAKLGFKTSNLSTNFASKTKKSSPVKVSDYSISNKVNTKSKRAAAVFAGVKNVVLEMDSEQDTNTSKTSIRVMNEKKSAVSKSVNITNNKKVSSGNTKLNAVDKPTNSLSMKKMKETRKDMVGKGNLDKTFVPQVFATNKQSSLNKSMAVKDEKPSSSQGNNAPNGKNVSGFLKTNQQKKTGLTKKAMIGNKSTESSKGKDNLSDIAKQIAKKSSTGYTMKRKRDESGSPSDDVDSGEDWAQSKKSKNKTLKQKK